MNKKFFITLLLFLTAGCLYNVYACTKTETNISSISTVQTDTVQIFFNNSKELKLFPNPLLKGGVQLICNSSEALYFYLFDEQGTLLHQALLKGKEEKQLTNLQKGTYSYDIFKGFVSVERGKIIVH